MSRVEVPVTNMVGETVTAHALGTAIDATDDMYIDAGGDTARLLIRFDHTTAGERVATIVAPTANPHAPRSPLGNVAITMAAGNDPTTHYNIVIESARFAQPNGRIHLDFAGGTTGRVWAYRLPRGH